jgi:membrane associated rhomboid family serine protease
MSSYYRGPYAGGGVTLAFPPFTPMVKRILWVLGIVFLVQSVLHLLAPQLEFLLVRVFGLNPQLRLALSYESTGLPIAFWQLATYALLHGSLIHILFNALGIWMFGGDVERVLGSRGFLRYFVVTVLGGGLAVVIGGFLTGSLVPVIGASGGVLGLVLAFAMFFPERRVFIFPIPFPLPAWVMAVVYGLMNLYGAVTSSTGPLGSGVSYAAHLGGLVAGYLYLKGFIKPGSWSTLFRRRRKTFQVIRGGDRPGPYDIN